MSSIEMFLMPLPDEHIYSYLFRRFRLSGEINIANKIFNPDGHFKKKVYIPECYLPFISKERCNGKNITQMYYSWQSTGYSIARRSGMLLKSVKISKNKFDEWDVSFVIQNHYSSSPESVKFCRSCVEGFIRDYGFAYLPSIWLGYDRVCGLCNKNLYAASCSSAQTAFKAMTEIFMCNHVGIEL